MSNDAITIGSKTTTGGEVISGASGLKINGVMVALVGDIATCKCGSKSCKGQGKIVATSPRNANVGGAPMARVGDFVDTGCGSCYLVASQHQVSLATNTASSLNIGSGVNMGNGVNINGVSFGGGGANAATFQSSATSVTQAQTMTTQATSTSSLGSAAMQGASVAEMTRQFNAPQDEADLQEIALQVDFETPIISFALMSLAECAEFYQNLYDDIGGKETISNTKDYIGTASGIRDSYKIAEGLGGLGVAAYTKNIHGQDWVIIKNFRRHAQTLMKGNKWLANNPQVVQAGLGLNDLQGAMRYVTFNTGVEIAFSIGINAADYILRDEATLTELGVNTAGDITKGMISLVGAGIITASIPVSIGVLATGGIFVAVSFGIGKLLGAIDENNGYSKEITKSVEEYFK